MVEGFNLISDAEPVSDISVLVTCEERAMNKALCIMKMSINETCELYDKSTHWHLTNLWVTLSAYDLTSDSSAAEELLNFVRFVASVERKNWNRTR